MTQLENFKRGFLQKCAEENLTKEETLHRIRLCKALVKVGQGGALRAVGKTLSLLSPLARYGLIAALVGAPLAGLAAGVTIGSLPDDSFNTSKEEAKKFEELAEYRRALDRLRRLRQRQMQTA